MRNYLQIGQYTSKWPGLSSSETRQRLLTLSGTGHHLCTGHNASFKLAKTRGVGFNYKRRIHAGIG